MALYAFYKLRTHEGDDYMLKHMIDTVQQKTSQSDQQEFVEMHVQQGNRKLWETEAYGHALNALSQYPDTLQAIGIGMP